jgi:hypothetical protein
MRHRRNRVRYSINYSKSESGMNWKNVGKGAAIIGGSAVVGAAALALSPVTAIGALGAGVGMGATQAGAWAGAALGSAFVAGRSGNK